MKKTLLISVLSLLLAGAANAVELKEGSLYCVDSKKIIAYYDYLERKQDKFAQKLMDKSDCFIKRKNEDVLLQSENKDYVELELLSGFTIWTKKENINR